MSRIAQSRVKIATLLAERSPFYIRKRLGFQLPAASFQRGREEAGSRKLAAGSWKLEAGS